MRELKPGAIRSKRRAEWRKFYAEYMRSKQWFERRARWEQEERTQRSGGVILCEGACGKVWTLKAHMHHVTYDRLGREAHRDLWPMCEDCHYALHRLIGQRSWRKKPRHMANYQGLAILRAQNQGLAGNQRSAVLAMKEFL